MKSGGAGIPRRKQHECGRRVWKGCCVFGGMTDSEMLAHRETGGAGDKVGGGLEANYEGPGVP